MSNEQKKEFLQSKYVWRIDNLAFKDVKYFKDNRWRHFLRIVLDEGKKRHIRRVLKALGYKVLDLKRIKFGKYQLWNLKEWKWRIYKYKN
jgi:23S rRNA pseudouridine2605 synthase